MYIITENKYPDNIVGYTDDYEKAIAYCSIFNCTFAEVKEINFENCNKKKRHQKYDYQQVSIRLAWYYFLETTEDTFPKRPEIYIEGIEYVPEYYLPKITYYHGESQTTSVSSDEFIIDITDKARYVNQKRSRHKAMKFFKDYVEYCRENSLEIRNEESVEKWNKLQNEQQQEGDQL